MARRQQFLKVWFVSPLKVWFVSIVDMFDKFDINQDVWKRVYSISARLNRTRNLILYQRNLVSVCLYIPDGKPQMKISEKD